MEKEKKSPLVDPKIRDFISLNKVFTIATSANNIPYCAICFYAWAEELNLFAFMSHKNTRHSKEIENQKIISGTITIPVTSVLSIKGLQFSGIVINPDKEIRSKMMKRYLAAYPYATVSTADFYIVEPIYFKLTDNSLGFGKKLVWERKQMKNID